MRQQVFASDSIGEALAPQRCYRCRHSRRALRTLYKARGASRACYLFPSATRNRWNTISACKRLVLIAAVCGGGSCVRCSARGGLAAGACRSCTCPRTRSGLAAGLLRCQLPKPPAKREDELTGRSYGSVNGWAGAAFRRRIFRNGRVGCGGTYERLRKQAEEAEAKFLGTRGRRD